MYQHHTQCFLHCTSPYQSQHSSRVIPHTVRVNGYPSYNPIEENKLFYTRLTKTRIGILSKYNIDKRVIRSVGKATLYGNLPFLSKLHHSPYHMISYFVFSRSSLVIGITLLVTLGCIHPWSDSKHMNHFRPQRYLFSTLYHYKGD